MDGGQTSTQHIDHNGISIAYDCHIRKDGPGYFYLSGYRSSMNATKAQFVKQLAEKNNVSYLSFDYSGHGQSGGDFAACVLSDWIDQALKIYAALAKGPMIIIGSSMGGWIGLHLAKALQQQAKPAHALLLLAPAPDFTHDLIWPTLTNQQKADLDQQGFFKEPGEFGHIFTKKFLDDGDNNRLLTAPLLLNCPTHIIQGMNDDAVPYQHSLKLMHHLAMQDATLTLIKDGDHRLSRPKDLLWLEQSLDYLK